MTQRQVPGGGYVNETAVAQRQFPGGPYVNERAFGPAAVLEAAGSAALFAAAGLTTFSLYPTLSAASATDITSTSLRPRVTITF